MGTPVTLVGHMISVVGVHATPNHRASFMRPLPSRARVRWRNLSGFRTTYDRLLGAEIELRRSMEAVASARRGLPPGGEVLVDYAFQGRREDGSIGAVRLSELFVPGKDSLAIYSFMFPRSGSDDRPGPASGATAKLPLAEGPCPSCTALLDQLDGAAPHVAQRMNFAVVAKAPLKRLLTFAEERGWRHLRLLSSSGNRYNQDYFGEVPSGQEPMLNVFHREDARIRHFWGSELLFAPTDPGQEMRHVGTLEPLWNLLDFTPQGRGTDWEEQLHYGCCSGRGIEASGQSHVEQNDVR
jgi:predicted dithiol-disulfide oxidoreductase (DUF899 family)